MTASSKCVTACLLRDDGNQIARLDLPGAGERQARDSACDLARDAGLHLHGLDRRDGAADLDLCTLFDLHRDGAGERGCDVIRVGRVALGGVLRRPVTSGRERTRGAAGRFSTVMTVTMPCSSGLPIASRPTRSSTPLPMC